MTNITPQELVAREVYYCVSPLIHELIKNEKYMDDLMPVLCQDGWESALTDNGYESFIDKFGVACWKDTKDGATFAGSAQDACEFWGIEPQQIEAFEHWIISGWLADKLEAEGEMILRDFLGLIIWGRSTTGQAIYADYVIEKIHNALVGKAA